MIGRKKSYYPGETRISYIRRPLAKRSIVACALVIVSLALLYFSLSAAVRSAGQAGLNAGAMGFCSFLTAFCGLCYSGTAFFEADRNYLLAKIMLAVSGVLVIGWAVVIITGMMIG